jgi:NAD(P)-dependent dehydrogenase (short-subunit alcohol dehydrogenase family)
VEAIADGLRVELRPWGIHVVLIEPGSIDTDIWRSGEAQLDAALITMSSEHRALYGPLLEGAGKVIRFTARRAAPVANVARAVETAVTAPRPRTRYVVGADARAQILLRALLPDRAHDALVARIMGVR